MKRMMILDIVKEIGLNGLIDIAIMSAIVYALIVWFQRSKAAYVFTGIVTIGFVYLLARQFNLLLTAAILQGFFAVILLAVIIIFQEDFKYLFERVGTWRVKANLKKRGPGTLRKEVEILSRTATDLATDKIGALLVLRGRDIIDRHLTGGVDLNGELSEAVLKSLFDPHSIGHDGAVVVDRDRILQFSCHLPLSKDLNKVGRSGTRHAAALGMAEVSDSLCISVSEELGTISVAYRGEIELIQDFDRLTGILEKFYSETYPEKRRSVIVDIFTKNVVEKITALLVTLVLWFVFVHESRLTYKRFTVPVNTTNLASELEVADTRPHEVEVTLGGKRSQFYFFNKNEVRLFLNMLDEGPGTVLKQIQESEISLPEGIVLESVTPGRVRMTILEKKK